MARAVAITDLVERYRLEAERLERAGLDLEPGIAQRNGARRIARREQRIGQVAIGLRPPRFQRQRAAIGGDGLVEPAVALERDAEIAVQLGVIGGEAQRLAKSVGRLGMAPERL